MTTYTCQKCAALARVENGVVVPSCPCKAPLFANLHAVARGAGGVK